MLTKEDVRPKSKLKSVPISPIAPLANSSLRAMARFRVGQWDQLARNPEAVQIRTLLNHCKFAANTEFGKTHHLGEIRSYEDFKKQVPLRTYAGFEPFLERMRNGASDILWPGLIPYYGQSSGSSSTAAQHKFLPISREQIRFQQKAAFDLVARYLMISGDRSFTGGYNLGLLPPSTLQPAAPGVHIGSNPGIMLRHVPSLAKLTTIPQPPVRDIPDYNEKLRAIAETYLNYDVRSIAGTTCWFSIFFDVLLETAKKRGLRAKTVQEIWPNLRVLFGGGVYAEPYRQVIHDRVGRSITIMDNYNATEGGIFATTDSLSESGMLMVPDRGVFYEFVAQAEHGRPDAKRVPLWEVEVGVPYSVVLTTSSGLFGYYIGDFVKFVSKFPHRIEFVGRASGMLSLTQELVSFVEIERSVSAATQLYPCQIKEFAASSEVGVDRTGKGRYIYFMEFEREPTDTAAFTDAIDRELCQQNRVYREHRAGEVAILSPRMVKLLPGTSQKFMKELGYNSVQNKFPRIIDEKKRDLLISLNRGGIS